MKKNDENIETDGKKGFTEKQKQEFKKYTVYGLLFILFLGLMWFNFKPTAAQEEEKNKGVGLNTEIPAPETKELTDNKKNAYEQEYLKQKQTEKTKALNNFALLTLGNKDTVKHNAESSGISLPEEKKVDLSSSQRYDNISSGSIRNSVDSYKKTNQAISDFYSVPKETEEVKKLKEEIENLKEEVKGKSTTNDKLTEQTELMERSYKLAAKYFPKAQDPSGNSLQTNTGSEVVKVASVNQKNNSVAAVRELGDNVVSALPQTITDDEFIDAYSQERNIGFYSPSDDVISSKNTIKVCIDKDQVIIEGQSVDLRLLVPVQVGNMIIPENSLITGKGNIEGERLFISINSIAYEGTIVSVSLKAYDLKGQLGVPVRDMIEISAAKEVAGNLGGNLGTSISLNQNAEQQLVSDLGKSLIQGTSQYIQKKVRTVKVNLRANDQLLLVADKN